MSLGGTRSARCREWFFFPTSVWGKALEGDLLCREFLGLCPGNLATSLLPSEPQVVGWQSYILNQTSLTPNLHFQLPAGSLHQRAFSNCVQNPALLTTTISALPNGTFILLAANSKAFLFPSPHPVSCDLPATVGQTLLTTTCLVLAVAPFHCSGAVHLLCPSLPVWSSHNGCDQVLRDFHCLLN